VKYENIVVRCGKAWFGMGRSNGSRVPNDGRGHQMMEEAFVLYNQ
jgi:hypothetical protein